MSLASPPGRVTLADFRQMQALLLETRQQLEDSRDRERVAREELQQRPVLPDPASFPPPPPRAASRAVDEAKATRSYPDDLNPFGPASAVSRVAVHSQTEPSALEIELHDELRRTRDTLRRIQDELQSTKAELADARVRRLPHPPPHCPRRGLPRLTMRKRWCGRAAGGKRRAARALEPGVG